MIRLDLLYLSFSYLACWFLIWKCRKKRKHVLINQKLTLRPYCLFSKNIAYAFIFFVYNRKFYNLSYVLFSSVLIFYLGRYNLGIIYIVLLLFNKRILKTMSLDIFGTENQMFKLESDFSKWLFISMQKSKRFLKEEKDNIYLIFCIFWKLLIPFRLFLKFSNH